MIEAFLSTIEESAESDLILIVVDASDEIEDIERKLKTNYEILSRIGCSAPIITVFNKCDKIDEEKKKEILLLTKADSRELNPKTYLLFIKRLKK